MDARVIVDRPHIPLGHATGHQTVNVLVELTTPEVATPARPPIDVAVVLDRSGSMSGAPIHAVREATCDLTRLLRGDDRLAVIAFDDRIDVVATLATPRPDATSAQIRAIEARGSTNLAGGWLKAFEILAAHGRAGALRRIIVLTDGHANEGIVDRDAVCALVAGARAQGVTTSTIGFDSGFDELVLSAIADAGGGNDYWCAGPSQAAAVFAAEFGGLTAVAAHAITIEVDVRAGVEVSMLGDQPTSRSQGRVCVAVGDAYSGEQRKVIAALDFAAPRAEGDVELADITVRWTDASDHATSRSSVSTVAVRATAGPAGLRPPDTAITEQVDVLRAARAQRIAHERIAGGDAAGARQAMAETVALLAPLPAQAAAAASAEADLALFSTGGWTPTASKRLHASMRAKQTGRNGAFDEHTPPRA